MTLNGDVKEEDLVTDLLEYLENIIIFRDINDTKLEQFISDIRATRKAEKNCENVITIKINDINRIESICAALAMEGYKTSMVHNVIPKIKELPFSEDSYEHYVYVEVPRSQRHPHEEEL